MTGATVEGAPADAVHGANDTLAAASAVAADLPGYAGDRLLDTARAAFTHGMQYATVGGAVILALAAIGAAWLLRAVPVPEAAANGGDAPKDAVDEDHGTTRTVVHKTG
jgi:DHA2 family multidrug resistance protein-like MFS transporter